MNSLKNCDVDAIVKAVVTSVLLSLALAIGIGFLGSVFVIRGAMTGEAFETSLPLFIVLYCIASLPNVIGGYLAAKYAKRDELEHGVLAGIALLTITGVFYLVPGDDPFAWSDVIGLMLITPLATVGALLRKHVK